MKLKPKKNTKRLAAKGTSKPLCPEIELADAMEEFADEITELSNHFSKILAIKLRKQATNLAKEAGKLRP